MNKTNSRLTQKINLLALIPVALLSVGLFLFAYKFQKLPRMSFEPEIIPITNDIPSIDFKLYTNREYGFTAEVPNFSPWVESKAGYYYVANEASVMIIPIWEETGPSVVEFLKKIKQEVGGTFTTILGELPDAPNAVIGGEPAVVLFYPKTPMSPAGFDAFVVHNGRGVRFNCTRPERANALEIYKHVLSSVRFRGKPYSTKLPNILTEYPNY